MDDERFSFGSEDFGDRFLYHYTSAGAMHKVLHAAALRLGRLSSCNDPRERKALFGRWSLVEDPEAEIEPSRWEQFEAEMEAYLYHQAYLACFTLDDRLNIDYGASWRGFGLSELGSCGRCVYSAVVSVILGAGINMVTGIEAHASSSIEKGLRSASKSGSNVILAVKAALVVVASSTSIGRSNLETRIRLASISACEASPRSGHVGAPSTCGLQTSRPCICRRQLIGPASVSIVWYFTASVMLLPCLTYAVVLLRSLLAKSMG